MEPCALYLITPPAFDPAPFARALDEALEDIDGEGIAVACLQLRLKGCPDADVLGAAKALRPVLERHGVALLINDRADLAKKSGADGVHLGQDDGSVSEARRLLGPDADIGVTCHDSRHLAMIAAEEGADYVAFGAFYPTATKETVHRADPDILVSWTMMTTMPCVAIGGITPANAAPLVEAGADYIAVSSSVFGHDQGIAAALRAFGAVLRREA